MTQRVYPALMRFLAILLALAAFIIANGSTVKATEQSIPLFSGTDLSGWHSRDAGMWRVEEGAITGGSLTKYVKRNSFLVTNEQYQNFDLTLKIKLTGTEGFINSGIQVRSQDASEHEGMVGYQVDVGNGWWGKLYDEGRRDAVISLSAEMPAVQDAVKPTGWNLYRIRCENGHLQSWINGVAALDYKEKLPNIPQIGHIGIQIHSGGKALVQVKDIHLTNLH
ncbi:MAG: DUF1080 domain-containing protein [Kordiimonadaceae bacterium]|nr:DUF1080 domain-containing protein [Kordiimonadaceae bacterium]